jgi:hypothetical protein
MRRIPHREDRPARVRPPVRTTPKVNRRYIRLLRHLTKMQALADPADACRHMRLARRVQGQFS